MNVNSIYEYPLDCKYLVIQFGNDYAGKGESKSVNAFSKDDELKQFILDRSNAPMSIFKVERLMGTATVELVPHSA